VVKKPAFQFEAQRFTSVVGQGVAAVFIEKKAIVGMAGKLSSICVHRAKQSLPLLNGRVGGDEHDLRTKFECVSSVTGFASLVGVTA
jgi:hypothetical protein